MLVTSVIVRCILIIMCTITLPYLSFLFWKVRRHFMISARSPMITLMIVLLSYTLMLCAFINTLLTVTGSYDKEFDLFIISIRGGFSYLVCVMVMYRLLLVYDRWVESEFIYNQRSNIIISTDSSIIPAANILQTTQTYSCCNSKLLCLKKNIRKYLNLILVCQFIFFCSAFHWPNYLRIARSSFWTVYIFISCIIIYKSRQIKEKLSIKTETTIVILIIILLLIFMIINVFVFGKILPYDWMHVIGYLTSLIISHIVLLIPLYQVHSIPSEFKHELQLKVANNSIGLEIQDGKDTNDKSVTQSSDNDEILPLYQYLDKGMEEYDEFVQFLTESFALENLFFLIKVLLFRHNILKQIGFQQSETVKDEWKPSGIVWDGVFGLKFHYIENIEKCSQLNNYDIHKIPDIAKDIYNQFIVDDAEYQVNIIYDTKDLLDGYFASTNNDKHSIEEYLVIFNNAIKEIYILLTTVYRFQYRSKRRLLDKSTTRQSEC